MDLVPITNVKTNLEKSAKSADFVWRFVEKFYRVRVTDQNYSSRIKQCGLNSEGLCG